MDSGAPHPSEAAVAGKPSPGRPSLLRRLLTVRVAGQLVRNTIVSCVCFAFDLLLLWAFVEYLGMNKLVAAAIAFLIATSLHYAFAHGWIFKGTEQAIGKGYAWFLVNALVGLVLTIVLFWAFMAIGFHYLVARVIASVFAGLSVFLLNAVLNFRSV
ncbi:MAG TPA: GtrA family protein [Allosphingosinicella sp.]|nr:GtrA family protein [Allosphingosinicella sp.]